MEPQEYRIEYQDPGRHIPILFLVYSWGSLFGIPGKVPFPKHARLTIVKVSTPAVATVPTHHKVRQYGLRFKFWVTLNPKP